MDNKCAICGKRSDLFSLRFEADETDAGEPWTTHVCGTCWEVIAAIARRACKPAGTAPDTSPAGDSTDEAIWYRLDEMRGPPMDRQA